MSAISLLAALMAYLCAIRRLKRLIPQLQPGSASVKPGSTNNSTIYLKRRSFP